MTVVADASPLIFLGKIRRLALIDRVLGGDVVVAQEVRDEVLARPLDPAESDELHRFLATVRMERVDSPRVFATARSTRWLGWGALPLRDKLLVIEQLSIVAEYFRARRIQCSRSFATGC